MRCPALSALLWICGTASAYTMWSFDFASLPTGWTATSQWQFTPLGAVLDITTTVPSGPGQQDDEFLTSNQMTIPAGVDTIVVVLEHDYSMTGWATNGYANASLEATLCISGVDHTLVSDAESWGFKSPATADSRDTETCIFPVTPGDWIQLTFHGHTYAVMGGSATLEWSLYLLEVDDGAVELSRSTWAGIKALFPE
jgi:hypothetical protein